MSRAKAGKVIIRAVEVLRRSRNELHIQHRLHASGTGAHKNRKRYCRKDKHRADYRSKV